MDDNGTFNELRAKHDALVSRLSPAARHQAFPDRYVRPIPREAKTVVDPTQPFRAEIALLREELAATKRENGRMTILLQELSRPMRHRLEPSIRDVLDEFCRVMNDAGRNINGEPWNMNWLRTKRRMYPVSHPRHVCMWLVREICVSLSLPMIGAALGGMDHTSIMHGCKKAQSIMDADPGLRHVAIAVLRRFGVNTKPIEDKADQP